VAIAGYEVRRDDVLHERLDGETIIVNMRTGRYLSLQGVAADIWFLISNRVPRHRWLALLAEVYQQPDDADIDKFTELCLEKELIREAPEHPLNEFVWPTDVPRLPWSLQPPEEFDDLADLILIDPVHDVDADGWPIKRES